MKEPVTLGVACLARKTFDHEAARNIYESIKEELKSIEAVTFEFADDLVIDIEDAESLGRRFSRIGVDGLVLISGTFHLGHLALILKDHVKRPILLWGLNELPYDGGKIRLNSVCGVNLDASNLYKAGVDDYHVIVGNKIDEAWIDAIRIKKRLKRARIGLAGYHASGFFNLDIDELDLHRETGCLIEHLELSDIFNRHVDPAVMEERLEEIENIFDTSELTGDQARSVARLSLAIESIVEDHGLDALAIRCWPEFARDFGISPCAAMSFLQSRGLILACEGDVLAAMTMLAHAAIGAGNPFLADLSQIDFEKGHALLWHCGVAPCDLWDEECSRTLDTYFAGGKGVTAGFVMKGGTVSIARVDFGRGKYRVFLQDAMGIPMCKELKGTYLKVTVDEPVTDMFERIVYNGIAHHVSVVYGDFRRPFEIFARMMGWEVISGK